MLTHDQRIPYLIAGRDLPKAVELLVRSHERSPFYPSAPPRGSLLHTRVMAVAMAAVQVRDLGNKAVGHPANVQSWFFRFGITR